MGLFLTTGGALGLWAGADLRRRSGRWFSRVPWPERWTRQRGPWHATGRLLLACALGAFLPSAPGSWLDWAPATTLAWVLALTPLIWLALVARTDRRVPR